VQKRSEGSENYDEEGDSAQKSAGARQPGEGKRESVSTLVDGRQSAGGAEDSMCVTVDSNERDETAERRRERGERGDGGKMGDERQRRRLTNLEQRDDRSHPSFVPEG
jgi:hypothetical protein